MAGNPWEAHAGEDELEQYAMGVLDETAAGSLEEHLLLCTGCQKRLAELDEFLKAIRNPATGPIPVPGKGTPQKSAPPGSAWAKRHAE